MNNHVRHPRQLALQGRSHVSCNRVGRGDRERRIDFDVKVDEILKARFSREHFVDPPNACDRLRHLQNLPRQFRRRHGVGKLERCVAQHAKTCDDDHDADGEPSVVIGCQEPDGVVGRQADGGEGGKRGQTPLNY